MTRLGVDETSSKKGHKYVTLGVDLDASRVIQVCAGRGRATLKSIQQHLERKCSRGSIHGAEHGSFTRFYCWRSRLLSGCRNYFRSVSCRQITQQGYG
ncbi:MAG TPA: hypothetical protein EYG48_03350 [Methylococcales bacterium]|nr:hypothetical protein [Methylococcales bacterium]